jgi:hypothetical protein
MEEGYVREFRLSWLPEGSKGKLFEKKGGVEVFGRLSS